MAWTDFNPLQLTREQFADRIKSLRWKSWKPSGIVLHNTASPTLAQWVETGPKRDARIRNLQSYYEGLGWKGGPHWFVSRDWINEFNNPLRRGTHSPSFNATHFGIEMVGDYDRESFSSGDGAKVRDNAVFVMARLCEKFGWDPGKVIKLHKEDPRTTHECPGKLVNKADVIERVRAEMGEEVPAPPPVAAGRLTKILATEFGGDDDPQDSAYGGKVDGDAYEVSLPARVVGRRSVRVFCRGKSVVCTVNDIGPWNRRDAYWKGSGRPLAEEQRVSRTKAQNGRIPSNEAGIDLTPAVYDFFGVPGPRGTRQARVDWEFSTDGVDVAKATVDAQVAAADDIAPLIDADEGTKVAKAGVVPVENIEVKPLHRSKTIWGGIIGYFTTIGAAASALFENLNNKYALMAFLGALGVGGIATYLVIKGRIDVQALLRKLLGKDEEDE